MLGETNKAIVRRYLELLRVNKRPGALDTYVDDPSLMEHIQLFEAAFPGYYIEVFDIVAEGERVVVRGAVHGAHKGLFMGVPPTGRTVNVPLFIEYKLANGRIVNHWMLADIPALMQQLGVNQEAAV